MGAYLRVRIVLLLRSRAVLALLATLASLCVGASLVPLANDLGPELYISRRKVLARAMEAGEVAAATADQAQLLLAYDAQLAALELSRPSGDNAWRTFAAGAAEAARLAVALGEDGTCPFGTGGVLPEPAARAEASWLARLRDGGWDVWPTTADEPALARLARMHELLPRAVWVAPVSLVAFVLARDRSAGRLLAQAPVPRGIAAASDGVLAWVSGLLALALAWGAGGLVALRNGVGSLVYPAICASDPTLFDATLGTELLRTCGELALLAAAVALAGAALGGLLRRRTFS